jgi:hypothetical protein
MDQDICGQHNSVVPYHLGINDWLFIVLRPAQEYFTHMETSPLPVKGCKIYAYARRSGPLSREGSLSCHTCCDTGPRFFQSHPKDRPIQSPLTTRMGMRRTYSNPDPHGDTNVMTVTAVTVILRWRSMNQVKIIFINFSIIKNCFSLIFIFSDTP